MSQMDQECLNCGRQFSLPSENQPFEGCPECDGRVFSYTRGQPEDLEVERTEPVKPSESTEATEPAGDAEAPGKVETAQWVETTEPSESKKYGREIIEEIETVLLELEEERDEIVPGELQFDLQSIKVKDDGVFEISLDKLRDEKPLIVEFKEGKYRIHLSSLFGDEKRIDLEDLDV